MGCYKKSRSGSSKYVTRDLRNRRKYSGEEYEIYSGNTPLYASSMISLLHPFYAGLVYARDFQIPACVQSILQVVLRGDSGAAPRRPWSTASILIIHFHNTSAPDPSRIRPFLSRVHNNSAPLLRQITPVGADVNLKWKLNSKRGSQEDPGLVKPPKLQSARTGHSDADTLY